MDKRDLHKYLNLLFTLCCVTLLTQHVVAEQPQGHELAASVGIGRTEVADSLLSLPKNTGSGVNTDLGWRYQRANHLSQLKLNFGLSSTENRYELGSKVYDGMLSYDYQYKVLGANNGSFLEPTTSQSSTLMSDISTGRQGTILGRVCVLIGNALERIDLVFC